MKHLPSGRVPSPDRARRPAAASVRIRVPQDTSVPPAPAGLAADERERREHIRRWAKFMIVHLERSDFDHVPHLTYEEALERLKALVERELRRASADRAS
ncbi:MAG TPA: hypothetical protein VHG91_10255 [Longimicrobium sp.]|nr:hypothetical protein [Longimicrobium sp.]